MSGTNQFMLPGEALNSSDEEESQFDRSGSDSLEFKGLVIDGEAPESDFEDEIVGSTVSLVSVAASLTMSGPDQAPEHDKEPTATRQKSPGDALKDLDPLAYKKHLERNKSLRKGLVDNFLEPLVVQHTKRLERLSQNLSNSQMQMQEALLQSRIGTGNLLRLQMELNNFGSGSSHLRRFRPSSDETR